MRVKHYEPHPCPRCLKQTSRKTYCKPCLDFVKRPQYIFQPTDQIPHAERIGKAGRRNENINEASG